MSVFEKRKIILELYNEGIMSSADIFKRASIPLSTVYRVVKNIENGQSVEHQKGAGRKLDKSDRIRLGIVASKNRRRSIENIRRDIISRGTVTVFKETVRKELQCIGWQKKKAIPSPLLKSEQCQRRLNWCLDHVNYNLDNVIFTGESSVWLYPNNMWTKDNERPLYQRPKHSPKFHVCGGVSSRGAMPLCVFDCNMTAEVYTDILEGFLLLTAHTLFEDGFVLQQDNDPKHTSRHAKRWFDEKNVDVLQWPSYSPDLNPIENIWALMKDAVNQKTYHSMNQQGRSLVIHTFCLYRKWSQITFPNMCLKYG